MTYTFVDADFSSQTQFWLGVRNSDGHNYHNTSFGDKMVFRSLIISSTSNLPPTVNSFKINNSTTTTSFSVGDTVTLAIDATDPNNLPIEYLYKIYNGSTAKVISDWSSQSSVTYTFVEEDNRDSNAQFWLGVRNNDGHNYHNTSFGDRFTYTSITLQ